MTPKPQIGRPRDTLADGKILRAALTVYGQSGWAGFNLTQVAKEAGVGKSTMYNRFRNRETLLISAFEHLVSEHVPTGDTVQDLLLDEIEYRLDLYFGQSSQAVRRIFVEMASSDQPVSAKIHSITYDQPISQLRSKLWKFKQAGIIPGDQSITRLLDAVEGSVLMRAFCLDPANIDCFKTEFREYAESVVSDQLSLHSDLHSDHNRRLVS